MDPLSVTASVIAVATLAGQTCKYLKELRTLMGALPGRLHTLNNEVADMELVLQSVADLIQPIGMPSGGGGGLNAAVGGASKTIGSTGATTANSSSGAADPENENYQSSGGPPDLPPAPAHAHAHATTTTTTTTATNTTIDISKSTGPTDEELHVITTVVSRAQGYLDELRTLADQIQRAGGRSKTARLSRLKAFRRELPRLNTLQDELTRVKANLNVILGAANTRSVQRMHVELIAVSTTFQTDIQNDQALVAREQNLNLNKIIEYLEQIHQRVNRVETMLSDQQERYDANQAALLGPVPPPYRSRTNSSSELSSSEFPSSTVLLDQKPQSSQRSASMSNQLQSVNFHVARRVSSCRPGCSCACHRPKKNQTPSIVDRIFGQLFISYAGVPILSAKCDNPRCLRAQQPEVQTEYWFPPGVFWSQIIRFQATYQAATGPSFQLKTLRRVPDTAEAVTFAMNGNIEGLKSLFIRGLASPVDVSDTRGYSLLRWALYSNQYKTCEFLVHAGADPDYRPKALTDNSPRNKASDIILQGGLSRETVEALSCMTSSSDWIENQDFPIVHEIVTGLRFGNLAEVLKENPHLVNSQDAMGRTPLLWAAARGDETAVVTLLAFGADPNILDIQWSGPVAYSADRNHTACTRILLEAGAATDVELPGGYKIGSPLNCAARNATDPLLIKTLLDFDAQVDACGVDGRTALIHAARTNNLEFALILLEYNAQINWTSSSGQTPLTTAVIYNSHDVLKLLLGRWQEYNSCPRLKGPHLLQVVAQYADLETILILSTTDHFKLKYDKNYCTGEFAAILNERHDADEKLTRAFAEFLAIIDEQVSQDSLMEGGLLFRPCGTPTSDHGSQGTEPDEFVDALASLDIKEEN